MGFLLVTIHKGQEKSAVAVPKEPTRRQSVVYPTASETQVRRVPRHPLRRKLAVRFVRAAGVVRGTLGNYKIHTHIYNGTPAPSGSGRAHTRVLASALRYMGGSLYIPGQALGDRDRTFSQVFIVWVYRRAEMECRGARVARDGEQRRFIFGEKMVLWEKELPLDNSQISVNKEYALKGCGQGTSIWTVTVKGPSPRGIIWSPLVTEQENPTS